MVQAGLREPFAPAEQARCDSGSLLIGELRKKNGEATMKRIIAAASLAALCCWSPQAPRLAQADDYPSRPIKLVLPQPAGGAVDLIARSLGDRLAEQMKQPVIVENMPGANGSLAGRQRSRARRPTATR